jgi:hypothetical protein
MPAGSTYTPIATTTLGSSVSTYTFSSIPSTYTDLIMVFNGTSTSANISLQFNGDTGSNYSSTRIRGNGTTASSNRFTSQTVMIGGSSETTNPATVVWQVFNYSSSTTNKSALCRGGGAGNQVEGYVGLWRNTGVINSLTVFNSGTLNSGSTLTLYGIAAA